MELRKVSFPAIPAKSNYSGSGELEISSGKHLKIETAPGGLDILDAIVPEGKVWKVKIDISIEETEE